MPDGRFTSETARKAAAASAARRTELARLAREDPEALIRELFTAERAGLTKELLDAAYGRGNFGDAFHEKCPSCGEDVTIMAPGLMPEKRLAAVTKALEYAVGRPTPRAPEATKPADEVSGLHIE